MDKHPQTPQHSSWKTMTTSWICPNWDWNRSGGKKTQKPSDPRKKYKDSKSSIIQGSRGAKPYSEIYKLFKYDKYVYIYICMYQHLERGAKWFLKGINSLSLRVQLAAFLKVQVYKSSCVKSIDFTWKT